MSKPARGTKRVCQSCGARFYDLSRSPIVCPVCQTVYQVTPPASRRAERAPAPEPRPKPAEELETVAADAPETISLEEVDEGADDVADDDEEIVDLGDVDTEIPAADDDDDTFLEEPEGDEEADVSGIVSGPEKEES
jgi:uncharacterized protein (TIGR02300 family)